MQILRNLTPTTEYTAVALGYFDGMHIAHQKVINSAVECKKQGLTPIAFTFISTPKAEDKAIQINTYEEKCRLFEKAGIEILYIIDFELIRNKTPEDFVKEIVKGIFNAKKAFCGFNYHFGKNGAGNTKDLIKLCKGYDIEVGVCEPVLIEDTIVSATQIRKFLLEGKIELANKFLGYDYGIVSTSVEGNHIGTNILETPTVNQEFQQDIVLPKFGVYASIVTIDNNRYYGVSNIGVKPTIGDNYSPLCETWLPLYKGGDLYGKVIDTRLKAFIRPEKKFDSLEELKAEIRRNGETAVEILRQIDNG